MQNKSLTADIVSPSIKGPSRAAVVTVARWLLVLALFTAGIPAFGQAGPMVSVSRAEQSTLIEEVPLTGSVVSPRIARLSTEVSGIIESLEIEIGDQVKAGDEILQLNEELEALFLEAAAADTEQAMQELEDARRRLAVARPLAQSRAVAVNEIDSLAAEVRIDSAGLKRYQATQKRLTARLERHRITAPFDGVISQKLVEQGEWIQPGQPVVELVASTGLRIDFQVPQTVYPKLEQTAEIRVQLDAHPGKTFDGVIDTIIPVADTTTRNFLIRVALNNPSVKLAPGMSASAVLRLDTNTQGVVVHRDALIRYPDGRITVWVVTEEGSQFRASERQVLTGPSFNGKVVVTSGLSPDTLIVLQGNEALQDNQIVVIKNAE